MRWHPPIALLLLGLVVLPACGRQDPPEQEPAAEQRDAPAPEAGDIPGPDPAPRVPGSPAAQPAAGEPAPAVRPAAREEARTGRIAVTGTAMAPFTTLQIEGERSITLVGELEEELRRLSGITVRVFGTDAGDAPFGRRFEVRRYELLSVDGERPHVGTLIERRGATWLATATDTLRIGQLPETLQGQTGARVWIVGPLTGDLLQIQSYGVIRP